MDFELDSEHEMIRQTVRDFAEKEVRPVAAHVDKTGGVPKATGAKMAGRGVPGGAIPTGDEGGGLGAGAPAVGLEENAAGGGAHGAVLGPPKPPCARTAS